MAEGPEDEKIWKFCTNYESSNKFIKHSVLYIISIGEWDFIKSYYKMRECQQEAKKNPDYLKNIITKHITDKQKLYW